jgi:hypothetical protein
LLLPLLHLLVQRSHPLPASIIRHVLQLCSLLRWEGSKQLHHLILGARGSSSSTRHTRWHALLPHLLLLVHPWLSTALLHLLHLHLLLLCQPLQIKETAQEHYCFQDASLQQRGAKLRTKQQ